MNNTVLTGLLDAAVAQELGKAPTGIAGLDQLLEEETPSVAVLDGVVGFASGALATEALSMVDAWLLLRNVETVGERNRLLFVLKTRGTAHSNQVREFVLTDHRVELVDVYIGAAGVLAGSARVAQQAAERNAEVQQDDDLSHRRRELHRSVIEPRPTSSRCRTSSTPSERRSSGSNCASATMPPTSRQTRSAMATRRWADTVPGSGAPGSGGRR